jgi:phospholipid/cholesterol/gamma-HCH transport system substrate-binding protein
METRAHFILVGLFTLVAGAAALLFALWLTNAGADREVSYFDVLFREPVSGLSVGSAVQYSGIRVGEVGRLTLDPEDPRIVRARVRVTTDVPVKVDTKARLTLLNITGASAIEFSEGLPASAHLTSSSGVPVIEATPSSFAQLQDISEELLFNASTLIERTNRLLSDENGLRVSSMLENVELFTASLAEQRDTLREGLDGLALSTHTANEVLIRVNTLLMRYEEPVLDGVTAAVTDLQQFTQKLNVVLDENSPSLSTGLQGFAELAPAMRDLREILNTVDVMTRRIADDPANFVLGNDNIREYQP